MLGIISDLHLKQNLSYSDLIKDGRKKEEKKVLDFIVSSFKDVDRVIFVGDLFHNRTNSSEVIRKLVEFIERFDKKEIYIISGNHCKLSDGKTTIDFLKEVKNPKWHIMTEITKIEDMVFCPNISKSELEVESNEAGKKKIMEMLPEGRMLFHHYAMTGSKTETGMMTEMFDEIVLDKNELKKKYKLVVGGHVHSPRKDKNVIVTGSIFTNQINEKEKYIWEVNEDNLTVEQIKLPCREIHGLENPTINKLEKIPKNSIVKVTITDLKLKNKTKEIKEKLKEFDGNILLENFPSERKKAHFDDNLLEFDILQLLEIYAKSKKVEIEKLKTAFELIK